MSLYSRIVGWLFPDDMFDAWAEEVEHDATATVQVLRRQGEAPQQASSDESPTRDGEADRD